MVWLIAESSGKRRWRGFGLIDQALRLILQHGDLVVDLLRVRAAVRMFWL
jgi:hypothetical protein